MTFGLKDSGARQEFSSGMVRDTQDGKVDFSRLLDGPMFDRWAEHLSKGAVKYPDVSPGVANWTLAAGEEELARFRKSAFRHFRQWMRGDVDEDHASAVFFNINGAEYVKNRLTEDRLLVRKNEDPTCNVAAAAYVAAHVNRRCQSVDELYERQVKDAPEHEDSL